MNYYHLLYSVFCILYSVLCILYSVLLFSLWITMNYVFHSNPFFLSSPSDSIGEPCFSVMLECLYRASMQFLSGNHYIFWIPAKSMREWQCCWAFCLLSSDLWPLSSVFCLLYSVFCILPSVFCILYSAWDITIYESYGSPIISRTAMLRLLSWKLLFVK